MAEVRPFRAFRPKKGMEATIASLPYDVFSKQEARAYVEKHPGCFLSIDRAETQFQEDMDTYDPKVYEKAGAMLRDWMDRGDLVQDDTPCYYLYQQTWLGRSQTGIVGCASVDDYLHSVVKKHENTVEIKEQDRINHVAACQAQTGPVFLAYRNHAALDALTERILAGQEPVYDFVSTMPNVSPAAALQSEKEDTAAQQLKPEQVRNRVWVISDPADVAVIREAFAGISQIYIADGHHRCAAAVKVCQKEREAHPDYTGEEPFNFFLSVLFPADELEILPYNRVVKDRGDLDKSEILLSIKRHFSCQPYRSQQAEPSAKGEIGMYLDHSWYMLTAKNAVRSGDPVDGLDVSILQHNVLAPLFHINNPRTDPRIEFVGGIRGLEELEKKADASDGVAFAMYPTDIHELFAVADAGRLMPPKSTWFEPKLLSGLFIHKI